MSTLLAVTSSIILFTLLGHIVHHLNRNNYFKERSLQRERQSVHYLSTHDQLTGLYNHRHFKSKLKNEFKRSRRYGNALTLLMIDLDHFKKINDNYGHPTGDRVLKETGQLIRENCRSMDIAGRYGGEEFGLLLPQTDLDGASRTAKRLLNQLRTQDFRKDNNESFSVTCSIGLAEMSESMEDPEDLILYADRALYEAKEKGRNQYRAHRE